MPEPMDTLDTAADLARKGKYYALEALKGAGRCDSEKALRLSSKAKALLDKAKKTVNQVNPAIRAHMVYDDGIKRTIAMGRDYLADIDAVLERCRKSSQLYDYKKKAGSWVQAKDGRSKGINLNQVYFEFKLKRFECEKLCYIAVYHVEDEATGKTMQDPSVADIRTLGSWGVPPEKEDVADGYVVDAHPMAKDPCWSDLEREGDTVKVYDRPAFIKPGYTAYFEVCVVCLDPPEPKIFGVHRFSYSGTSGKSEIQPNSCPPTLPFQEALSKWLNNRKKK